MRSPGLPLICVRTVGDKLVVKFDFTLAQDVNNDNGNDFRFSLFDTDAGPEGMEVIQLARLGNQGGFNNSMLKVRIDQTLAPINSGTTPSYGNAYAPGGGPSTFGNPLWKAGDVHTFTTTIERVGSGPFATTHVMTWEWMNSAGTTSMSLDYRDSNGSVDGAINAGDTWIGGLNKINGFGLTIFSKDPFDADGLGGSGTISNFSVTGTPFAVPEPSSAAFTGSHGLLYGHPSPPTPLNEKAIPFLFDRRFFSH